jgi:hypothetical protein
MRLDLRALSTHVLVEALGRIERAQAQPPWSSSLAFELPAVAAALAPLDAVPSIGIIALISAVIDERANMPRATEVVWTGPEPVAATSRDTAAVVAGMFRDAEREVLVSCYSLDAAEDAAHSLFAPLHASMIKRAVKTSMFFDVEWCAKAAGVTRTEATHPDVFIKLYWPFGPPFPDLYLDPRALEQGPPCSMHAKMVVVDRRFVLVGSANLTDRGQTRNIELGVKVDDTSLAERIAEHWMGAVANGGFRACAPVVNP